MNIPTSITKAIKTLKESLPDSNVTVSKVTNNSTYLVSIMITKKSKEK